ncbi:hypothetical protein FOL47_007489 [Perkinsus chesapeaki]|uniref:Aminotransferase class I/classII large domain-containing protein n=1 Tax=Perkinsus chesapeaki TaxID=330153 RepID=A0A7J6LK55_PERCH|nr:hypothetical protein FOL47_007489 [Perkinsus chesapeaki]
MSTIGEPLQNGKVSTTLPQVQPIESQIRQMTRMAAQHNAINLAQGFPNESPHFAAKDQIVRGLLGGNQANAEQLKTYDIVPLVKAGHSTLSDLLEAVDKSITGNDELNQYAIPYGRTDLREAISAYYRRFYNIEVHPEKELTICLGATEAMASTLRAICKPGESILVFEPFHEIYPNQAAVFYLHTRYCRLYEGDDDKWYVDWEMLEDRLQDGSVRAILLNTPHNPTGKVFEKEELTRLAQLAVKYDTYIVTDEIYEHMIFEGEPHQIISTFPEMKDRSFIISAISKSASATGWRVGWVVCPPRFTETLRAIHDQMVLQSPSPMQFGTIAFTKLDDNYFKHQLPDKYKKRRDVLVPALRRLGFKVTTPHAAYYAFANFREVPQLKDMSSWEASDYLVEKVGVAGVAGANFCERGSGRGEDYIRFCFCRSDDEIQEAIRRLEGALC